MKNYFRQKLIASFLVVLFILPSFLVLPINTHAQQATLDVNTLDATINQAGTLATLKGTIDATSSFSTTGASGNSVMAKFKYGPSNTWPNSGTNTTSEYNVTASVGSGTLYNFSDTISVTPGTYTYQLIIDYDIDGDTGTKIANIKNFLTTPPITFSVSNLTPTSFTVTASGGTSGTDVDIKVSKTNYSKTESKTFGSDNKATATFPDLTSSTTYTISIIMGGVTKTSDLTTTPGEEQVPGTGATLSYSNVTQNAVILSLLGGTGLTSVTFNVYDSSSLTTPKKFESVTVTGGTAQVTIAGLSPGTNYNAQISYCLPGETCPPGTTNVTNTVFFTTEVGEPTILISYSTNLLAASASVFDFSATSSINFNLQKKDEDVDLYLDIPSVPDQTTTANSNGNAEMNFTALEPDANYKITACVGTTCVDGEFTAETNEETEPFNSDATAILNKRTEGGPMKDKIASDESCKKTDVGNKIALFFLDAFTSDKKARQTLIEMNTELSSMQTKYDLIRNNLRKMSIVGDVVSSLLPRKISEIGSSDANSAQNGINNLGNTLKNWILKEASESASGIGSMISGVVGGDYDVVVYEAKILAMKKLSEFRREVKAVVKHNDDMFVSSKEIGERLLLLQTLQTGTQDPKIQTEAGQTTTQAAYAYALTKGIAEGLKQLDEIAVSGIKSLFDTLEDSAGSASSNVPISAAMLKAQNNNKDDIADVMSGIESKETQDTTSQAEKTKKETETSNEKERCLDTLAFNLSRDLLKTTTKATIKWINSGLSGKSNYTDSNSFFRDIYKHEVSNLVNELTLADEKSHPYAKIAAKKIAAPKKSFSDKTRNTLDKSVPTGNAQDFSNGSVFTWEAWEAASEPQNNPLGYERMVAKELANRTQGVDPKEKSAYQRLDEEQKSSGGFFPHKICLKPDSLKGKDLSQINPPSNCSLWETVTPGPAIAAQLNQALTSPSQQLQLVDEWGEFADAGINSLFAGLQSNKGAKSLSAPAQDGGLAIDECTDGKDNDKDTKIDALDPDCI